MATFLWIVVVLMAAALLAQIVALLSMVLVARRAARRAQEIKQQISEKAGTSVRLAKEMKHTLLPQVQTVSEQGKKIGMLLKSRFRAVQAVHSDASWRAEQIRLRLSDGVQTVGHRRQGIYHDLVQPVRRASRFLRGLQIAFWVLRKVA